MISNFSDNATSILQELWMSQRKIPGKSRLLCSRPTLKVSGVTRHYTGGKKISRKANDKGSEKEEDCRRDRPCPGTPGGSGGSPNSRSSKSLRSNSHLKVKSMIKSPSSPQVRDFSRTFTTNVTIIKKKGHVPYTFTISGYLVTMEPQPKTITTSFSSPLLRFAQSFLS